MLDVRLIVGLGRVRLRLLGQLGIFLPLLLSHRTAELHLLFLSLDDRVGALNEGLVMLITMKVNQRINRANQISISLIGRGTFLLDDTQESIALLS